MDGDLRRMSIKYGKLPINPNPLLNRGVQINSHTMQNETAEAVICYSKKLEDTLREIGFKIKHHEDNIKFLKAQKNKLNNSILDIEGLSQIILGSKPCWQLFAWHVMDLKHWKHMIRKVLLIKVLVFTDLELQLEDLWMTNILSSVLRT